MPHSAIHSQKPSAYISPLVLATKFHNRIKQTRDITGQYILIFKFLESKRRDEESGSNGSRHSWRSVSFNFCIKAILTRWTCSQYLALVTLLKDLLPVCSCFDFVLHSLHEIRAHLVFSAFTSRPVSILATNKAFVFFFTTVYVSVR